MCRLVTLHGILMSLVVVACGSPSMTAPSAPAQFSMSRLVTALKIGERWSFSTNNAKGPITWRSDNSAICSIDQDGSAMARAVGAVVISASDTQSEVKVTVQVVPDVDGQWSGQTDFISCTRISGGGPEAPCFLGVAPYSIDIQQTHDRITAHDSRYNGAELLTGAINANGTIQLVGESVVAGDTTTQTKSWSATLDASGTLMGDRIDIYSFSRFFGTQVIEAHFKILYLKR